MDVELPDGTVIEGVPEGTTKAQLIAKLKSGGYDVSALTPSIFNQRAAPEPVGMTERYGPASEALSGLMDIGAMIGAGGMVAGRQIAEKPVQPLIDVAKGAVGLPMMAGQAAMGDVAAQQQLRELPSAIAENYAQAYGSPKAAFMTAATEPGRFVSDIMAAPSLAGAAAAPFRGVARTVGGVAAPIIRNALNPKARLYGEAFGAQMPEAINALATARPGLTSTQALADVNAPLAQAVGQELLPKVPQQTFAAQQAQEASRAARLGQIAGTPEQLALREAARSREAAKNYQAAFEQVAPEIPPELLERPSMKTAYKVAETLADERGAPTTPMGALHDVKIALDKIVSKPEDFGIDGAQKAAIQGTRKEFIAQLEKNDAYKKARADFAAQSVPINKMQVAQELQKAATAPLTGEATRGGMFARAVEEAPRTIKKSTGQTFFNKLEDVFDPEEMQIVNDVRDEFRRTQLSKEQARLAESSAKDLASAQVGPVSHINLLNRVWTIANTIVRRSLGKIDEKLAVEIGLEMLEPAQMKKALEAAQKYNAETKRIQRGFEAPPESNVSKTILGAVTARNVLAPQQNQNAMAR